MWACLAVRRFKGIAAKACARHQGSGDLQFGKFRAQCGKLLPRHKDTLNWSTTRVDKSTLPHRPSLPRVLECSHRRRHLVSSTAASVELQSTNSKPTGSPPWRATIIQHLRHSRRRLQLRRQVFLQRMSGGPLPLYSPILFASPVLPAGLVAPSTVFGAPSTIFGTPASLAETTSAVEVRHKILVVALVTHLPSRGNTLRLSPLDWPFAIFQICACIFLSRFNVFPSCMLDLISFAVEVVGLDYVIEAVSRPPSLPAFLLHPPSSLSYPEIPLFDQLRHQLLTSAAIHDPSTFLQFVIFMVDEFHIDRVLGHRQPRRPRGVPAFIYVHGEPQLFPRGPPPS